MAGLMVVLSTVEWEKVHNKGTSMNIIMIINGCFTLLFFVLTAHMNAEVSPNAQEKQEPISQGIISKTTTVKLAIPPLEKETQYTYTPTAGPLANRPITLTIKYTTEHFKEGDVNLIKLYAQLPGGKPVFIIHITPQTSTIKEIGQASSKPQAKALKYLHDVHAEGAQVKITPEGNILIQRDQHKSMVFDTPARLSKKRG